MPAIASGQSQNITIQAGEVLNFDALGAGSAVIANGQEAGTAYNIGTSAVAIGPFTSSRTISVSVSSAISYFIGAAQIDIIATRTPPDNSPALSGASAGAVKKSSGASGVGILRALVAGHSFATLHDRTEDNGRTTLNKGYNSKGFVAWACKRVNNRAQLLGHAGVSGELLSAFMLRLDAVIARSPDICVLVHGLNDFSVSASVRPVSAIFADLVTCWERMRAAGITVIATTVTPVNTAYAGTHTARRSEIPLLNDLIVSYCAQNGIYCADLYSAVVSPLSATGEFATGYTYDNLHLSTRGAWAAATPVAAILDKICPPRAGRVNNNYDTRGVSATSNQLLNNPMLDGGTTVATSWEVVTSTGSPTVTSSKVTLPDGTPGQRIQLSAAAAASVVLRNSSNPLPARVVAGEIYRGEMDVKIDSNTLCNRLSLDTVMTVDGVDLTVFGSFVNTANTDADGVTGSYTEFSRPLQMPPTVGTVNGAALGMYIGVAAGGSIDITLSRAELRRLPAGSVIAV